MAKFADYQRRMWTALSYLTVCRFYIEKDQNGKYSIRKSGKIRTTLYYLIWMNSVMKISYLVLTYHGWLVEVHFLDQMSMWDWFLCFSQLVQETNIWYRKYPLYETLHVNWTVQEEVFRKLGSPTHLEKKIISKCKSLVYMHSTIVFVGCGALLVQFFTTPKYALNTYAAIPYDTFILRILFAAHEYIYMFHIWVHQASSIVLVEVFSLSYSELIPLMTDAMRRLVEEGKLIHSAEDDANIFRTNSSETNSGQRKDREKRQRKNSRPRSGLEDLETIHKFIPDRMLDPNSIAPGTEYDILGLLQDYRNVMMASREFNNWAGKLMGGTTLSNYGQFVSDVFMMIQLLKEPDTDIMGVFFFFEDACAGMCMLFRMLFIISRVYPASSDFMEAFKEYLQHESPIRKYLRKYQRNLRIVAAKIGGMTTNPTTVPKGINALMNYYIGAAMWQRPVDRRT